MSKEYTLRTYLQELIVLRATRIEFPNGFKNKSLLEIVAKLEAAEVLQREKSKKVTAYLVNYEKAVHLYKTRESHEHKVNKTDDILSLYCGPVA